MLSKYSGMAAGAIGGAMLLLSGSPASAAPVAIPALVSPADTAQIEQVQDRRWSRRGGDRRWSRRGGDRRWSRNRHGPRYRHARPGFRHHHGGYYYSRPWWSGPGFGFSLTVPGVTLGLGGGRSAHVQWCMNRYRTYDPASDTYVPRVGQRAYCNSPYR